MGWDIDKEGSSDRSDRLPVGTWEVEVTKVAKAKDTKNGDRQILVVFTSEDGREAVFFAPVEGKARFKAAQLMKGLGYTSKMIEDRKLAPDHLLIQAIADDVLVGNRCRIEITKREGSDFLDVRILPPIAVKTSDEVPF